jgi:hypothetical protein
LLLPWIISKFLIATLLRIFANLATTVDVSQPINWQAVLCGNIADNRTNALNAKYMSNFTPSIII